MWLEPAFPWTSVVFLVFHRLRAMEGVWWMIAAILRQIAAARQPDGSWPMPPLWAWFSHLLST
jgi:hypothetical protein